MARGKHPPCSGHEGGVGKPCPSLSLCMCWAGHAQENSRTLSILFHKCQHFSHQNQRHLLSPKSFRVQISEGQMFTDIDFSRLHSHKIFLSELGTWATHFQLNLCLWALEVLFENSSPVNTASNKQQKTGFEIVPHPHWRGHSPMLPDPWLVHQWNAQMFKHAKHTQSFSTTQYSHQGGQNSALLFWSELGVEIFWKPGPTIYYCSEQLQSFNICWQKLYLCLQGSLIFFSRHFWLQ